MKAFFHRFPDVLFFPLTFLFSFWLMWHTFSYQDGSLVIASKAWSDFASHIPLIRSFSFGANWPPEYPIFSGDPIRYHFLFYLVVGLLEKAGLRLDFALNIPSALSFWLLLVSIYLLAHELFARRSVAFLSVLFFLFNSSFSFLEFFKEHPLSSHSLLDVIHNSHFPSFGPYDQHIVSAFWNLNIYTNQRHLALPLGVLLLLVFFLVKKERKHTVSGLLIFSLIIFLCILPFVHSSIFVMSTMVFGMLSILLKNQRTTLLVSLFWGLVFSLPRMLFLQKTAGFPPTFEMGYLTPHPFTIFSFSYYWLFNLGISLFLIPLGFAFSSKRQRKVFVAFLPLFIVANLVQFSSEMAGNHKFFNVFLTVSNIFSAYVTVRVWHYKTAGKVVATILVLLLTFSGVIDFFAIKNDSVYHIDDYLKNPDIDWIIKNTPKDSVFLNSSYLYNSANLAGRKIFLGWPYFSWSLGYRTDLRDEKRKGFLKANDPGKHCSFLKENNITFIEISRQEESFPINYAGFERDFAKVYSNPLQNTSIYAVYPTCK